MNLPRIPIKGLTAEARRDPRAKARAASAWAYGKLSSIRTSIYILGLLALCFMAGTVFPQGESYLEYEKAGGKFVWLVYSFFLLDFFSSPLFLTLAAFFVLNIAVCTFERYKALQGAKSVPRSFKTTKSILLTQNTAESHKEVRDVLKETLGFRLVNKDYEWVVMEKGLPFRWLTWAYHAGILICVFGMLLTFFLSFEENITLKIGEPQTVVPDTTGRLQSLWQDKTQQTDYHLLVTKFTTEYAEWPELQYPDDARSRAAAGLGWQGFSSVLKPDPLFTKEWKASVKALRGSSTLKEKELRINHPLKYDGYTYYLLGFEQELKLLVDDSPIPVTAKADSEFIVPGSGAALSFGTLRAGQVTRLDGQKEELRPYVTVKKKDSTDEPALLRLGDSVIVDGTTLTLADYKDSAILSYRYDPGVPVLWIGGIIVLAAMCLRFYGSNYLVAYRIDDRDSIVCLDLHISARGLGASGRMLLGKIEHHLTSADIKPAALSTRA